MYAVYDRSIIHEKVTQQRILLKKAPQIDEVCKSISRTDMVLLCSLRLEQITDRQVCFRHRKGWVKRISKPLLVGMH